MLHSRSVVSRRRVNALTGVNGTRNSIRNIISNVYQWRNGHGKKERPQRRARPALGIACGVRREDSMVSLSREASAAEQTLYRWRDLFIEGGCERLSGGVSPEHKEIKRLKKELAERDQVIGEQTIAVRMLKKLGRLTLTVGFKADVMDALSRAKAKGKANLTGVLRCLCIARSS